MFFGLTRNIDPSSHVCRHTVLVDLDKPKTATSEAFLSQEAAGSSQRLKTLPLYWQVQGSFYPMDRQVSKDAQVRACNIRA